jgi:hypothetical protein
MLSLRNLDQINLAPVHGGHLVRRLRHPGSARLGRDYEGTSVLVQTEWIGANPM